MKSSGIYYDECPYCGQFNNKRDDRGGCPACGGRYLTAEEVEELEPDYDCPYYVDGGVSLMSINSSAVWNTEPVRPYDIDRAILDEVNKIDDEIFDNMLRRWLGG